MLFEARGEIIERKFISAQPSKKARRQQSRNSISIINDFIYVKSEKFKKIKAPYVWQLRNDRVLSIVKRILKNILKKSSKHLKMKVQHEGSNFNFLKRKSLAEIWCKNIEIITRVINFHFGCSIFKGLVFAKISG